MPSQSRDLALRVLRVEKGDRRSDRDDPREVARLQHLVRSLKAIRTVNQLIVRERDRDGLLAGACRALTKEKGYDAAFIALATEGKRYLSGGEGCVAALDQVLSRGRYPRCVQEALAGEKPVALLIPARDCPACPAAQHHVGAVLAAKIANGGKTYGALCVALPKEFASEEEQALVGEVAGDLGLALHNLEVQRERDRLAQGLSVIRDLGRKLTLYRQERAIAQAVVETVPKITSVTTCGLWLVDEKGKELVRVAHSQGLGERRLPLASERGIIPEAVRTGKAIYVPDTGSEPRYLKGELSGRSEYCVPLAIGERTFGALNVEHPLVDGLSEVERKLLDALAQVAAVVLENARLFREAEESSELQRRILAAMSEGLAMDDAEGTIVYVNPAFSRLVGRAPEDLVGRHWTEIVPEEHKRGVMEAIPRRKRGEVDRYEIELERPDGERVPVLVSGAPRFVGGDYAGTIGVFTDISRLKQSERELRRAIEGYDRMLRASVRAAVRIVEHRDPYVVGHSQRVAKLALAIGRELGLSTHKLEGLEYAALLHDIGKIAVPVDILSKPGRLTPLEFELIKMHPDVAVEILEGIEFRWPILDMIRQHHERLDGSGYPRGLKDDAILLEARIIAVADVVEAMSSHRPYRPALGIEAALAEIERGKGTLYDPKAVDACLRLFREKGFTWD